MEATTEDKKAMRVGLIDGHRCTAQALALLLNSKPTRFKAVGVATTLPMAQNLIQREQPDAAILDFVTLEGGVESLRKIREMAPDLNVVVLTASELAEDFYTAMQLGVRAYVSKRVDVDFVISALRLCAEANVVIGPYMLSKMLRRPVENGVRFTDEEVQMLGLVAAGADINGIGHQMSMSESTVRRYLNRTVSKLGATNRVDAAVRAARLGLI